MNKNEPVKTNDLFRYIGCTTSTFEPGDTLWATHGADATDLSVTCAKIQGSTSGKVMKTDLVPIPAVHVNDECIFVGRFTDRLDGGSLATGAPVIVAYETVPGGREYVEVSVEGTDRTFSVKRSDLVLVRSAKPSVVYEARSNSDVEEGRGAMLSDGLFFTAEAAVAVASGRAHSEVLERSVWASGRDRSDTVGECVWGYRQKPSGGWDYGYFDFRDIPDPAKDPEVAEFLKARERLMARYGTLPA